jgi:hypothetical protein
MVAATKPFTIAICTGSLRETLRVKLLSSAQPRQAPTSQSDRRFHLGKSRLAKTAARLPR